MSSHYQMVKDYYDRGLWGIERVQNAVGKWITESEFLEITGSTYQ